MRARYIGDHAETTLWGLRFPRGVFISVDDPHAQMKLAGNREFEVETIDAEEVEFVEALRERVADVPQVSEESQAAPVEAESAQPIERQKRPYNRRK